MIWQFIRNVYTGALTALIGLDFYDRLDSTGS